VAGHPLRPATRQSLGEPLPHQQADRPRAHPPPQKLSTTRPCSRQSHSVLATVSGSYPKVKGRLLTCYSPVRRSCTPKGLTARLACVKHAASVRPEPGSNSPLKTTPTPQPQKARTWKKRSRQENQSLTLSSELSIISYQRNRQPQPQPKKPGKQSNGYKLIRRLLTHC
jgi:hypothetical protein